MNETPLRLDKVTRVYRQAGRELIVFRDLTFALKPGEIVALVGQSGAGKSSLLHIAGLLEAPSSGEVYINGRAASKLAERERTEIRRNSLGFVYQFHHLLPEFTALENVAMPCRIAGVERHEAAKTAAHLLTEVGLAERLTHRPAQLSGGEQQRVAIARALANSPKVLLADEPTGNLDPKTADSVFDILIALVRSEGLSALIATHNYALSEKMDRTLVLDKGTLVEAR
ncbi:MAG TPA: ABC transporter ATP-binding protein [Micropepsaceae bacterium]|nr:ABC transporter ATP-binding protein [Micropepsaceae bacterium]